MEGLPAADRGSPRSEPTDCTRARTSRPSGALAVSRCATRYRAACRVRRLQRRIVRPAAVRDPRGAGGCRPRDRWRHRDGPGTASWGNALSPARIFSGSRFSFGGIVLFGGIVVVRVGERKRPVGGWLLVLCLLLLVWQPISFGLAASTMLDRLAARGLPLALILLTRVVVAGFGIAAGLALFARRPGAVNLVRVSLILTAALDVFVYATPYFPTNLPPGDASLYAGASILYCVVWLAYLGRSKRVREFDRG